MRKILFGLLAIIALFSMGENSFAEIVSDKGGKTETGISEAECLSTENEKGVLDRVTVDGVVRFRYDHAKSGDAAGDLNRHLNADVNFSAKLNAAWSINGEKEFQRDIKKDNNTIDDDLDEQLYLTGTVSGITLKAGKFDIVPSYGVITDETIRGFQVAAGKNVKVIISHGQGDFILDNVTYTSAEVSWMVNNHANIKTNYQKIEKNLNDITLKGNYYETGFDVKVADNITLTAACAHSDASEQNKAYLAKLQYKAANVAVKGSHDVYLTYRVIEDNATISANDDFFKGYKGYRAGFDYVPAKDTKLSMYYMRGKRTLDDSIWNIGGIDGNEKLSVVRAQAEYYF